MVVASDDEHKCCSPGCRMWMTLIIGVVIVIAIIMIILWVVGVFPNNQSMDHNSISNPESMDDATNDLIANKELYHTNHHYESFGILIFMAMIFKMLCLLRYSAYCGISSDFKQDLLNAQRKHIMNPSRIHLNNYNTFQV